MSCLPISPRTKFSNRLPAMDPVVRPPPRWVARPESTNVILGAAVALVNWLGA